MSKLGFLILVLSSIFITLKAQTPSIQNELTSSSGDAVTKFRPSLAVVISILSILLTLTFIVLVYAKFCHRLTPPQNSRRRISTHDGFLPSRSRFSGIDKTVIESLPFFRFSSLRGSREGLECAVCLSKFEDVEILRLLPKCKHAFHIDCIDRWLEKHSGCPLCRKKISSDDLKLFSTYTNSLRFLWDDSEHENEPNLDLFIEREGEPNHGSYRFDMGKNKKQDSIVQNQDQEHEFIGLHKHNHRIKVSDFLFKNRWSNVSSSDLMFLNSEMINDVSSSRFSETGSKIEMIKEEMEKKRVFENRFNRIKNRDSVIHFPEQNSKVLGSGEKRSMSEITVKSRFKEINNERERIWMPIAQRTVEWFVNRERGPPEFVETKHSLNV